MADKEYVKEPEDVGTPVAFNVTLWGLGEGDKTPLPEKDTPLEFDVVDVLIL